MINFIDLEQKLSVPYARITLQKLKRKMTYEEWKTSKTLFELYRHGWDLYMGKISTEWELQHAGKEIMTKVIEFANKHEYVVIMKPWTFSILYTNADDILAIVPKKYEDCF